MSKLRASGTYEVIGMGRRLRFASTPNPRKPDLVVIPEHEIYSLEIPGKPSPHQEQRKYVLPPDEYPELYALHRQALWMRARARELER